MDQRLTAAMIAARSGDATQSTGMAQHQQADATHVLYVTSESRSIGCESILQILEDAPDAKAHVVVQDVAHLKRENVQLPHWLNGVPTLVHIPSRRVEVGRQAIKAVEEMCSKTNRPRAGHRSASSDAPGAETNDLSGISSSDPLTAGTWGDDETPPAYDVFANVAGCDPMSLEAGREDTDATAAQVERMMQDRGLGAMPAPSEDMGGGDAPVLAT